jgi:hypothetical protein
MKKNIQKIRRIICFIFFLILSTIIGVGGVSFAECILTDTTWWAGECNNGGCWPDSEGLDRYYWLIECNLAPQSATPHRRQVFSGNNGECDCSGTCFLPGTQVSTPQGDKNIETLKPGDSVFSFNELTGKTILNTVEDSPVRTVSEYYIIKTRSGREIKTTAEHPFFTGITTNQTSTNFLLNVSDFIKSLTSLY